jgi:PD-(D/E)XK endonuclease
MSNQSTPAEPRPARARRTSLISQPPKRKGEFAELIFVLKAASLGFPVSKPFGDSEPYDLIIEDRGRLIRIQVKSVFTSTRWGYSIAVGHKRHSQSNYSPEEIDFIAAYVAPHASWYIIPVREVSGLFHIRLYPRGTGKRGGGIFEQYREAWGLLPMDPPLPPEAL